MTLKSAAKLKKKKKKKTICFKNKNLKIGPFMESLHPKRKMYELKI